MITAIFNFISCQLQLLLFIIFPPSKTWEFIIVLVYLLTKNEIHIYFYVTVSL